MSSAKNGSGKPAAPADEDESLDFTASTEQQPLPAGAPPRPKPKPKPKASPHKAPAPKRRRTVSPGLLIISVAALVAGYFLFGMRADKTVKPSISKKAPSTASAPAPAYEETTSDSPASKPPPPVVTDSAPEIPAAFLKAFEAYRSSPNSKAIALALDKNGWAYAAVANAGSQATANMEALSDCAKQKGAAIKAECKLYAEGDSVVW